MYPQDDKPKDDSGFVLNCSCRGDSFTSRLVQVVWPCSPSETKRIVWWEDRKSLQFFPVLSSFANFLLRISPHSNPTLRKTPCLPTPTFHMETMELSPLSPKLLRYVSQRIRRGYTWRQYGLSEYYCSLTDFVGYHCLLSRREPSLTYRMSPGLLLMYTLGRPQKNPRQGLSTTSQFPRVGFQIVTDLLVPLI